MLLRGLLVFVFTLISYTESFAFNCEGYLSYKSFSQNLNYGTISADVNFKINAESYLGRALDFDDVVEYIIDKVPDYLKTGFISKVSENFENINFVLRDIDFNQVKLSYKNRLINYSFNRSSSAKVIWTTRKVETLNDFNILVESTIDLITEAAFLPIRASSIYRGHPSSFLSGNLEVMKDRVLLKLFTLNSNKNLAETTYLGQIGIQVKSLIIGLLPTHFAELRAVRIKKEHKAAYESAGPQGVYKIIRARHGMGLALKYWLNHLSTAQAVLLTTYMAFLVPEALHTYNYVLAQESISVDSSQFELSKQLLASMQTPAPEVLTQIEGHISTLSPAEQDIVNSFLSDVRFQIRPSTNLP